MGETVHFTRRNLLKGAAAAGAASLVAPRAGIAASALAREGVFAHSIGTLSGRSAPIHPGRSFSLVGIQWAAPAEAHVMLRAQAPDGQWTPWVTASALGPDGD